MTARTVSAPDLAQLGLGEALDEALAAHDLSTTSAAAIAVFTPDGVCDWRALGEPRRDGAPTQRGTVFRIASMTKSFLAATALALRDEGRLDLDGDLALIVPGIRFEWAGESVPVTIRQLLSNCSGMPEDNAWGDRQIGAERSWIAELGAAGFRLTAEPGERYQYSNLGMSFVGRAIEAVTGRSFEAEATTRFLDPLGLADTRFSAEDYPADADLAAGYRTFDGGESFQLEPFVGTGALACIASLFSSLDDVAAWATFLRSAFTSAPVSPALLAPASRRELQRLLTPSPTGPDREERELDAIGYGLGLVAEHDRRFGRIVQHTGGLPGHSSHMRWHVESGLGVVAFGNSELFGAEKLSVRALNAVLRRSAVPAETVRLWPETEAALRQLDDALRAERGLAELVGLFAENAMPDVPRAVRERRIVAARVSLGGILPSQRALGERLRASEGPAHVRWVIACAGGDLLCEIRLIGLARPLVQTMNVTVAGPDGATAPQGVPGVVTHARVLLGDAADPAPFG